MTPAFRENLGLGLGVLGTGLAAYGALAGPGKPKNPKRWQDVRSEYEAKNKALDEQRDLEIKQKFPKYYRLGQQLDDARAEKYTYLDMDYIDEGHPLWPKYEKAYDKVRDLEVKYWNAEDKYGPQGLTAIRDKYQKLKDENHQAYLKEVDTFNGLGEAKSIGAMLGGLGLIGIGGKLLSKTASDPAWDTITQYAPATSGPFTSAMALSMANQKAKETKPKQTNSAESNFWQKRKTPLTLAGMTSLAAGVHEATKPLDLIASRRSLIKEDAPQIASAKKRARDSIAWLRKNGVDHPNAWMYSQDLHYARNDLHLLRPYTRRYKSDLKQLLKRRNLGLGVAALGTGAILGANALSKSAAEEPRYKELSNVQVGVPMIGGLGSALAARRYYSNKEQNTIKALTGINDTLEFQSGWSKHGLSTSAALERNSMLREKSSLKSELESLQQAKRKVPKRILGATAAVGAGLGLYNAVQRAMQKGYEQRKAWYAKRKEKTASTKAEERRKSTLYSVSGLGASAYGTHALSKARHRLSVAQLEEMLQNTKLVSDAAFETAKTGRPVNPIKYSKGGTLAVQKARQSMLKNRNRNLAITAAGLGLLAYGNHINPDTPAYVKTSAKEDSQKRPLSWHNYLTKGVNMVMPHSMAEAAIPLAGGALSAGSYITQAKVLKPAREKLMQDRNSITSDIYKTHANSGSSDYNARVTNLNARMKQYRNRANRFNKLQNVVKWGPSVGAAIAVAGLPAYHYYKKKQQEK